MSTYSPRADSSRLTASFEPTAQERTGFIIEELIAEDTVAEDWEEDPDKAASMATSVDASSFIPDLYTAFPPIRDFLVTKTSVDQDETVQECLPYLSAQSGEFATYNKHGVPHLDRPRHIRFLHKSLQDLPSGYVAADAARPWFFYWALCGLRTLGEDVTSYRDRLISTVRPMQNETGGFGGGHGQLSHLAPTYAVVLSLAIVGGDAALDVIDRKSMWRWLCNIKQQDGGFQMFVGGEEDVRGAYCAAVIISLLDLPLELAPDSAARSLETDNLLTGIPEYVRRCQTYEGGISGRPDGEAHGAYTFCGLACLSIVGDPRDIIPKYLDVPALADWLSARQYAPEGGFSGRTNKLVDGCYSHWVGGCWPLLAAALKPSRTLDLPEMASKPDDRSNAYFDREGLIRYILGACQDTSRRGGLRDKPTTSSDGYHTCYVLAGLSSAQHRWSHSPSLIQTTQVIIARTHAYQWSTEDFQTASGREEVFDEIDRVGKLHPIFVIPEGVAELTRDHFSTKGTF